MAFHTGTPVSVAGACNPCCESTVDLPCCSGTPIPTELFLTFSANGDGSPEGYPLDTPLRMVWNAGYGVWIWDGFGREYCDRDGGGFCHTASGTPANLAQPIDAATCAEATKISDGLNFGCLAESPGPRFQGGAAWNPCGFGAGGQAVKAVLALNVFTITSCSPFHIRYENTAAHGIGPPYGVIDITA